MFPFREGADSSMREIEGLTITGKVAVAISRGQVAVSDGDFVGAPGHGTFLSRGLNQYLV